MIVCLAGENRLVTSRELEAKIHFPRQSILTAGRKLKKHGFVNTVNGPFGGYIRAKPPDELTVQEILVAYKDDFNIGNKALLKKTALSVLQNYMKILTDIKTDIDQLFSFTLADLLEER